MFGYFQQKINLLKENWIANTLVKKAEEATGAKKYK